MRPVETMNETERLGRDTEMTETETTETKTLGLVSVPVHPYLLRVTTWRREKNDRK